MYLPISVDPDRYWFPYGAGPPVLPFLTCEEVTDGDGGIEIRGEREM